MNIHRILQFGLKLLISGSTCKEHVPQKLIYCINLCLCSIHIRTTTANFWQARPPQCQPHHWCGETKIYLKLVLCTYVVCFTLEYWNQNPGWHWYSWIPKQEILPFFKISKACFSLNYYFQIFEQKYSNSWKITKFSVWKSMNIHRILQFGSKYLIPDRLWSCKENVPQKIEFTSFFCSHSQKPFTKFDLEHVFYTFVVCLAYKYWCQNPGWDRYSWIPKKEMIIQCYFVSILLLQLHISLELSITFAIKKVCNEKKAKF